MTNHDALLAAILGNGLPVQEQIAAQAEDTPRLAYADWLEENAGTIEIMQGAQSYSPSFLEPLPPVVTASDGRRERAEFIRVQIDIRNLYVPLAHIENGFTFTRDDSMDPDCWLADYKKPLLAELRRRERELFKYGQTRALSGFSHTATYSRGFISEISCSWIAWHTHADAILRAQPIERVRLTTRPHVGTFQLGMDDLKRSWPRIEFELPPEQNNSATWQFNLDLAAAENR